MPPNRRLGKGSTCEPWNRGGILLHKNGWNTLVLDSLQFPGSLEDPLLSLPQRSK